MITFAKSYLNCININISNVTTKNRNPIPCPRTHTDSAPELMTAVAEILSTQGKGNLLQVELLGGLRNLKLRKLRLRLS